MKVDGGDQSTRALGLKTGRSFTATDADAVVVGCRHDCRGGHAGVKALRSNGIDVVAIHNHMVWNLAGREFPALLGQRAGAEN
jgi:hypothetical protein